MTATLDMFQMNAGAKAAPVEPLEHEWRSRRDNAWWQAEDVAEEILVVTAKHGRLTSKLDDPTLAEQFPVGSLERVEAEAKLWSYTSQRQRLMKEFRQAALRFARLWPQLPESARDELITAMNYWREAPALSVAIRDEVTARNQIWRELWQAWERRIPVSISEVPF